MRKELYLFWLNLKLQACWSKKNYRFVQNHTTYKTKELISENWKANLEKLYTNIKPICGSVQN